MTKTLIVGNWKMHFNTHQASVYLHKLSQAIPTHRDVEVVLCPNIMTLQSLSLQVNHRQFKLGAQNAYWRDEGAYTGEISAAMLRGLVQYLIVGHSERRHIFNESDKDIRAKVQAALRNSIRPILCVGETAAERADNETSHVLHDQIIGGLANITSEELDEVVIAYEPVWAIGTGKNARPDDVAVAVKHIRRNVAALFGDDAAKKVRVLYGGSVTKDNASDYLATKGINGLLVGGASLQADVFASIAAAGHTVAAEMRKIGGEQ
ncbi:MAG TPA: triose-phosphate isomerase [Verrucomicrobiae bacterium]|nr:triose-phosphate isomerase [Verrucomicrobiae bacterium]